MQAVDALKRNGRPKAPVRFAETAGYFVEVVPDEVDGWLVLVVDFCVLLVPWFIVEVEFTSVDVWLALVELFVVFEPLPTFTPGLMLALALRSVFDTPTFAFTPTFGFTFSEELELEGLVLDEVPEVPVPEVPDVLDGLVVEDVLPEEDGLVVDVPLEDVVPVPLTLPELLRLALPEV